MARQGTLGFLSRTSTNLFVSLVLCLLLSPGFYLLSTISFFSGHTLGVSNAGVIPARVPPPIPPSCSASLLPPTASNSDGTLHFDLQGSRGKGYIGFELNDAQSEVFKLR